MLEPIALFNENFYLAQNQDVASAIGQSGFSSGFDHFTQFGQFEGRDPSAIFDTSYYLDTYQDVADAVEQNIITAFAHFIEFGQFEGRDPSAAFDTGYYLDLHQDVANAIARDELTGIEHFLNFGIEKERQFSPFVDLNLYRAVNPDLAIFNYSQAFDHLVSFGIDEGRQFTPTLFDTVDSFSTIITTNGNPADVYYPNSSSQDQVRAEFPLALLLPGGLVDKSQYEKFVNIVASYGFVVVVPNNERSLPQFDFEGFLSEASEINDTLEYIVAENANPASPIAGIVDTQKLVLQGHSNGGAVGLTAIGGLCNFPLCSGDFTLPNEVVASAFYGTNSLNPETGEFLEISNGGIPIALVSGSLEGVATPEEAQDTFAQISDPPKALITIFGANHFGITDENNPRGARPDLNQATLAQDQCQCDHSTLEPRSRNRVSLVTGKISRRSLQ